MGLVWQLELPSHLKLVLLAIADHANDDGWAYPGQTSLARKCSVSPRQVRSSISQLVEAGLLESHRRGDRRTNLYRVTIQTERQSASSHSAERQAVDSLSDRKSTASATGSGLPANHQRSHQEKHQQPARAVRGSPMGRNAAALWADIRQLPATDALLSTWAVQVDQFMEAGGEVTRELMERALARGIEQPSGWVFCVEGVRPPWPEWLPAHLLSAVQHPDRPTDPRWLRGYSYGPHSPVPAEKQPAIRAKARLLAMSRAGETIDEQTVQQVLADCYQLREERNT